MRAWMISFGVATAILVVAALLIDEGEVVHLETTDASGQHYEADLWIVDVGGTLYLRANDDDLGWLERIRSDPEVSLERDERSGAFIAKPLADPVVLEQVDRAIREKYGLADELMEQMSDPDQYVVVKLVPARPPVQGGIRP